MAGRRVVTTAPSITALAGAGAFLVGTTVMYRAVAIGVLPLGRFQRRKFSWSPRIP